jgi:hypothetical protein
MANFNQIDVVLGPGARSAAQYLGGSTKEMIRNFMVRPETTHDAADYNIMVMLTRRANRTKRGTLTPKERNHLIGTMVFDSPPKRTNNPEFGRVICQR